jgi:hypothetical protein
MKLESYILESNDFHYFCGYYDVQVFSSKRDLILVHRVEKNSRNTDQVDVGFIDLLSVNKTFTKLDDSKAFNWQQGSRLQFLGPDFESKISYNIIGKKSNNIETVIFDIKNNKILKIIPSTYCFSSDGKLAAVVDFWEISIKHPGYGYNLKYNFRNENEVNKDLIQIIDIANSKLIYSISKKTVLRLIGISISNDDGYVEHIKFSANSKLISFLYRLKNNSSIDTYLIVYSLNENRLFVANNSGRLTHYNWMDNDKIIAWTSPNTIKHKSKIDLVATKKLKYILYYIYRKIILKILPYPYTSNLLRRIIRRESYYLIHLENCFHEKIGQYELKQDGHPSPLGKNKNIIVTDTYPNSAGILELINYDLIKSKIIFSKKFEMDLEHIGKTTRADLHPKVDVSGKILAVDLLTNGNRYVCILS